MPDGETQGFFSPLQTNEGEVGALGKIVKHLEMTIIFRKVYLSNQ